MKNREQNQENEDKNLLAALRGNINSIDEEILHLLQKRAGLSKAVAVAKKGSITFRPEREKEVLERLYILNDTLKNNSKESTIEVCSLSNEHIQAIWREIFSCSRSLQETLKVSFLGPFGTFSHFASKEVFGESTCFLPCADFTEVFESVYKRESHFGIIPIENSQQGSVGQCLDLFDTYPVKIIAEHYSHICQSLLSTQKDLSAITEVFSHPQALMQSHAWLKKNMPHAQLTEMTSTAHAAKRALCETNTAVIGHEKLAQLDLLQEAPSSIAPSSILHVLAKDIAQDKNNTTRFVVITHDDDIKMDCAISSKNPKTSCTFCLPDKAGALSEILSLLHGASVNLSKLESRPLYQRLKEDAWQYRFFADAHADLYQELELLENIRGICHGFRILGVYENKR